MSDVIISKSKYSLERFITFNMAEVYKAATESRRKRKKQHAVYRFINSKEINKTTYKFLNFFKNVICSHLKYFNKDRILTTNSNITLKNRGYSKFRSNKYPNESK